MRGGWILRFAVVFLVVLLYCEVGVVCAVPRVNRKVISSDSFVKLHKKMTETHSSKYRMTAESSKQLKLSRGLNADHIEPWIIHVSLKFADSSSKMAILKVFTPFESSTPLHGRLYKVTDITDPSNEIPVRYSGAMIKRSAPNFNDVAILNAGSELSNEIDFSKGYQFQAGHKYRIEMEFIPKVQEISSDVERDLSSIEMSKFMSAPSVQFPDPIVFTAQSDSAAPWQSERENTAGVHRVSRPTPTRRTRGNH